jgi:hypothetical protein
VSTEASNRQRSLHFGRFGDFGISGTPGADARSPATPISYFAGSWTCECGREACENGDLRETAEKELLLTGLPGSLRNLPFDAPVRDQPDDGNHHITRGGNPWLHKGEWNGRGINQD